MLPSEREASPAADLDRTDRRVAGISANADAGESGRSGYQQPRSVSIDGKLGPLARLSLRHKVPMVAAGLILTVGVAISTAGYFSVRHTAMVAARQHVTDLVELVGAGMR